MHQGTLEGNTSKFKDEIYSKEKQEFVAMSIKSTYIIRGVLQSEGD